MGIQNEVPPQGSGAPFGQAPPSPSTAMSVSPELAAQILGGIPNDLLVKMKKILGKEDIPDVELAAIIAPALQELYPPSGKTTQGGVDIASPLLAAIDERLVEVSLGKEEPFSADEANVIHGLLGKIKHFAESQRGNVPLTPLDVPEGGNLAPLHAYNPALGGLTMVELNEVLQKVGKSQAFLALMMSKEWLNTQSQLKQIVASIAEYIGEKATLQMISNIIQGIFSCAGVIATGVGVGKGLSALRGGNQAMANIVNTQWSAISEVFSKAGVHFMQAGEVSQTGKLDQSKVIAEQIQDMQRSVADRESQAGHSFEARVNEAFDLLRSIVDAHYQSFKSWSV